MSAAEAEELVNKMETALMKVCTARNFLAVHLKTAALTSQELLYLFRSRWTQLIQVKSCSICSAVGGRCTRERRKADQGSISDAHHTCHSHEVP
eukprot:5459340-Amphidinium_carterae.1